jgi:hypothetical protein
MKKALLDPPQGASQISIEVLEAQKSGIYVCVNSQPAKVSKAERAGRNSTLARCLAAETRILRAPATKLRASCIGSVPVLMEE